MVTGVQNGTNVKLGFATGPTGIGVTPQSLSADSPSAYVAELDALVFALGISAMQYGTAVEVFCDCTAAEGVAALKDVASAHAHYATSIAALRAFNLQKRNAITFQHVSSHCGDSFNEMADVLAKASALGRLHWKTDAGSFTHAFATKGLSHLWWTVSDESLNGVLPTVSEEGNSQAPQASDILELWPKGHLPGVPLANSAPCNTKESCATWTLNLVTYNTTSLCSEADIQSLDACFHSAHIHALGLQETRRFPGVKTHTRHYVRFSSEADSGNLGCQLWVHRNLGLAPDAAAAGVFQADKAVIVESTPRILAVVIPAGGQVFGFVVAHALTAAASPEDRQMWWLRLDATVRKLPRNCLPILLLDANARFTCTPDLPFVASAKPDNHNAECMVSFTKEHQMESTPLFKADGTRPTTWIAPSGRAAQLDYVVLPTELATATCTIGVPKGFVDHNGFDHSPLATTVTWTMSARTGQRRARLDCAAVRTPHGQEVLRNIYRSAPQVSWSTHPDTHLQLLNDYLHRQLSWHFPLHPQRPRQSHISHAQWEAIRARRLARRLNQRNKHMRMRYFLAAAFQAWKSTRTTASELDSARTLLSKIRRTRLVEGGLARVIRSLSADIKQFARDDAAQHVRSAIESARGHGPAELARLLRGVMKTGRRYKPPRVQNAMEVDGAVLTDTAAIAAAMEAHFAVPEHGQACRVEDLLRCSGGQRLKPLLNVSDVPSLPDLVTGFQSLQSGKASGVTGIPAEAYSQAPLEAALLMFPLYIKSVARGHLPLAWKGTLSVALQKPNKPPHLLTSWRNIALHDACAKGIGKAVRAMLCGPLQSVSTKGQHGALRRQDIGVPSQYVQTYVRLARSKHQSGAVVFLDGQAAYYSILREMLFPRDPGDDDTVLRKLLETLHHSPDQQDAILASLIGPGLLAAGGAPPGLVDFLRHSLQCSWFALSPDAGWVQHTATGSVPGTPTADILFQFIQSVFLKGVTDRLREAGLLVAMPDGGDDSPQPSWADDVAILAPLGRASAVMPAVVSIVQIAEAECRAGGIHLNFGEGKTEALVIFRGPGSKGARQLHLAAERPTATVALSSGRQAEVRLVDSYIHLGHLVNFGGGCLEDIQRRANASNAVFRRLKATLLRNPSLTVRERTGLVRSLVHSKLGYGAGLWTLTTNAERDAVRHAYMTHWRQSCRVLKGVGSKFLSDYEVCALLSVPTPEDVCLAAHLRQLSVILRHGPRFLWQAIGHEQTWLAQAIQAVQNVMHALHIEDTVPSPNASLHDVVHLQPMLATWARRFTANRIQQAVETGELARVKAGKLAKFEHLGGVYLKIPRTSDAQVWICELCSKQCTTKAALAVHKSIVHGERAASFSAGGTACQVCSTQWWTTARLRAHVWRSAPCAAAYGHSDLDPPEEWEVQGTRKELAWRPPANVAGPPPWWATLRPTGLVPSDAVPLDPHTCLLELLQGCGQGSFEDWVKKVLQWVHTHYNCAQCPLLDSDHAWSVVVKVLCQLKERQYCTVIDTDQCLAVGDGTGIWLCLC